MNLVGQILGWCGGAALLLAYVLNSRGVIQKRWLYHGLNLAGAIGIAAVSLAEGAWPPMVLNVVWASIASGELYQLGASRRRASA
ncbi:MAG: hypothetical protein M3552_20935 [Planctomycetota bacterium]|nr:hypothetical protein [Planctomycetaceae bacterium]MDQ3333081.1 hypothetical protein [Planctomycetota bacterium]